VSTPSYLEAIHYRRMGDYSPGEKDMGPAEHIDCSEFQLPTAPFDDVWSEPGSAQEFPY
jgi:hypothetical protein